MKYDDVYAVMERSPTLTGIWHEVYGDDYPADAAPYGFVTLTDLRRMAEELRLRPEARLVDLGCGRGGPGLWVARDSGARLFGIDNSAVGIEQARQRAALFGMQGRATFQSGDAAATGLDAGSADGVMSVDAFGAFPDKPAVAREAARLLPTGARLVCTTWDSRRTRTPGSTYRPYNEEYYRSFLTAAGFTVDLYQETPNWQRRQLSVYLGVLRQREALRAELGAALDHILGEARSTAPNLRQSRRVLIAATRTG